MNKNVQIISGGQRPSRMLRAIYMKSEEEGQALVELALVLPVFVLILIGAAECARLAYASIEVANAARAGVQYGAQNQTTSVDSAGTAQAAAADAANLTTLKVSTSNFCRCSDGTPVTCADALSNCTARTIDYVQVNTSLTIDPMVHLPGLPNTYILQGQATMRVEQQ